MLFGLIVANQIEKTKTGTLCLFEKTTYRVFRKGSNNTTSFAEHMKFQEKETFIHASWVNRLE